MEINYSYSFKISENYNSKSVSIGVTDSVREGESVEVAYQRLKTFVRSKVDAELAPPKQAHLQPHIQPNSGAYTTPEPHQAPYQAPYEQHPPQHNQEQAPYHPPGDYQPHGATKPPYVAQQPSQPQQQRGGASEAQIKRMLAISSSKGFNLQALDTMIQQMCGKKVNFKTKQNDLTKQEYESICKQLES